MAKCTSVTNVKMIEASVQHSVKDIATTQLIFTRFYHGTKVVGP